jgi:hypothetical protein
VPGLGPAAEPLLFRQKWPKPCWPWHSPSGALRGSPTPAARKLATLKQCAPVFRGRLHGSAMPQGLGIPITLKSFETNFDNTKTTDIPLEPGMYNPLYHSLLALSDAC